MSADNLISFHKNKYAKEQEGAITIADFVRKVCAEDYAVWVDPVRRAHTPEARDKAKGRVPGFQLSGHVTSGPRKQAMQEGRLKQGFII